MAMEVDEWREGEGKGGREGFSLASVEGESHGEQGKPSEISPQRSSPWLDSSHSSQLPCGV